MNPCDLAYCPMRNPSIHCPSDCPFLDQSYSLSPEELIAVGGKTSMKVEAKVMAEHKPMSTIIFISTSSEDHLRSLETLNNACNADERCAHKIFFRPIMQNVFQWISGAKDEEGKPLLGCHEVLYLPSSREVEIARLEATKNVVIKTNSMCIVGDNDKKKNKVKKLIDWLLEETEDIKL